MELAITTELIDHEIMNKAIEEKELFIVPIKQFKWLDAAFVTKFRPIKRKRKDGKQRYDIDVTTMEDASPCYCEDSCGCGGDIQSWPEYIGPLTAKEIAEQFYFYPRFVVKPSS